jgi:hypothetical protein
VHLHLISVPRTRFQAFLRHGIRWRYSGNTGGPFHTPNEVIGPNRLEPRGQLVDMTNYFVRITGGESAQHQCTLVSSIRIYSSMLTVAAVPLADEWYKHNYDSRPAGLIRVRRILSTRPTQAPLACRKLCDQSRLLDIPPLGDLIGDHSTTPEIYSSS